MKLDERRLVSQARRGAPEAVSELFLARLAPEKRIVVALHYWVDYSTPEIAELLDLPLGTVASRLSRALAELRTELEGPCLDSKTV